jgi:hypothetical protein
MCTILYVACILHSSVKDPHHLDADPDPYPSFQKILVFHLQIDADPAPAYQFDANPDATFQYDADPDQQDCCVGFVFIIHL